MNLNKKINELKQKIVHFKIKKDYYKVAITKLIIKYN